MKITHRSWSTLKYSKFNESLFNRLLNYKTALPIGLNLLGQSATIPNEQTYRGSLSDFNPDETKCFFLTQRQITLDVEFYYQPRRKRDSEKNRLLSEIREITQKSWEDFGEVVHQWFEWSDILILAKIDGQIVGFNACAFQDKQAILFLASFVLPEYQASDIAKIMQNVMVKKFLLHRGKQQFFSPAWFTFRTQNPRVMQTISKFNAYPSVEGKKPGHAEVQIAKRVAKRFSPDCEFDETHFVIKGALKGKPDLLGMDKVFYSKNQKLNDFCTKHLEYQTQAGHLFVPVGRLNLLHRLYFLAMF